jgi:FAD/FMN-containing dehydrogenase
MAPTPELAELGRAGTARMLASLDGAAAEGAYLNLSERRVDPSAAFAPEDWTRLLEVRRRVDPTGIFLGNHAFVD